MKRNQKAMPAGRQGFVPVIIVLLVLIGFVGVYYLGRLNSKKEVLSPTPSPVVTTTDSSKTTVPTVKPTTDPTTNWKTYTNTKFNFSFKYPNSLVLKSMPIGNSQNTDLATSSYIILGNELYFTVSIGETTPASERGYKETQKFNDIIFAKMSFPNGDGPDTNSFTRFEIAKDDYIVVIDARGSYPISKVQDQILSTFKFTN